MLKIAVVGDKNVGKSSLVNRFVHRTTIPDVNNTVGIEITITSLLVYDNLYRIKFIDLSGSASYQSLYDQYLQNVQSIIIVFDLNKIKTFETAKKIMKKVIKMHGVDFPIFLVGNKMDKISSCDVKMSSVALGTVKSLCNTFYIETSATEGINTLNCLRMVILESSRKYNVVKSVNIEKKKTSSCHII